MTLPAVRELVMSVGISGINYYMKTGLSISIVSVLNVYSFVGSVIFLLYHK